MIVSTLAVRGLRRELRAGELKVLSVALVVAVAAVSAVGYFTDRVDRAMQLQAAQLLAADLVLDSSEPLPERYAAGARALGLQTARMVEFPSVLLAPGDSTLLVSVKAVSDGYPLRGQMRIGSEPYGADEPAAGIPPPGRLWLDARLFAPLGLRVGDGVELGASRFLVDRVLAYEPDRGGDLFQLAPRVLMNLADLPATGLVNPASRVRYRLLMAGHPRAVENIRDLLSDQLAANEHFHGVRDARPEMRLALDRAASFLGLAAVVAVLLAGAAVAVAASRYAERQADASAVMRCLGASQRVVLQLMLMRLGVIALLAVAVGSAIGFLTQEGLARLLSGLFELDLPLPSAQPLVAGLFAGTVTLIGFAVPPLLRVRRVPVLRVLRRDLGNVPPSALAIAAFGLAALAALVYWQARDPVLAAWVIGGTLAALVALGASAYLLVQGLRLVRANTASSWRYGMASISRHATSSTVQMVAYGIGIMALLLLAVVRVDIISSWQTSLPEDAPNHFIINIQPQDVDPLAARLAEAGIGTQGLYPMIRGRLVRINDVEIEPETLGSPRAERLTRRELNLSWSAHKPAHNPLAAGTWWSEAELEQPLVSLEQGIAELLGVVPGDRLTFNVAGAEVSARVKSLREVEWDSFEVNFFVIASPGALQEFPATYITSFHLPAGRNDLIGPLVREFPAITVLDVTAIMAQVRAIMDRAVLAVEYVFVFTLIAGLVVLYAAVQSTGAERERENAILRALGASRAQVQLSLVTEFTTLGLLAGLLAATTAGGVGWGLAVELFELDYRVNPWLWPIGAAAGGLGIGLAGLLASRPVLRRSPLQSLRRG